jgi:hypothetical protein
MQYEIYSGKYIPRDYVLIAHMYSRFLRLPRLLYQHPEESISFLINSD